MKNLYSQISSQYKTIELQTRIETASPMNL